MSELSRPTILIVDDATDNIMALAGALSECYDISFATSGQQALDLISEHVPQLILLDVLMPEMDGFEVCRRLKNDAATQDIPVIFITAMSSARDEELGLKIGAIDYISKPFSMPVVKARVHNHLLLKQRADLLETLASLDPLTHLPNRRKFDRKLTEEWKRAERDGSAISILMIDIDYFKRYNDNYGHGDGDSCLYRVAQALAAESSRVGDFIARYGGEEFIVILPQTDIDGAMTVGERLRKRIEELQIPHAYSSVGPYVSISLGCASVRPAVDKVQPIDLISAADNQLYKAKELGRNKVA